MCLACSGEAFELPDGETLQSYVALIPRAPDCECPCPVTSLGQVEGGDGGIQDGEVRCLQCGHPLRLQQITPDGTPTDQTVDKVEERFFRAIHTEEVDELNARLRRSKDP